MYEVHLFLKQTQEVTPITNQRINSHQRIRERGTNMNTSNSTYTQHYIFFLSEISIITEQELCVKQTWAILSSAMEQELFPSASQYYVYWLFLLSEAQ